MPFLPLRKVPESPSHTAATEWLDALRSSLDDANADRALICRQTLTDLFYPQFSENWETAVEDVSRAAATRVWQAAKDPPNKTHEPQ